MMETKTHSIADIAAAAALRVFGLAFSTVGRYREYLRNVDGWKDFSVGIVTEDGTVSQSIRFSDGKARVCSGVEDTDTRLIIQDTDVLRQLVSLPPNEVLNLILRNKMRVSGNASYMELFNLLISALMKKKQIAQMRAQVQERQQSGKALAAEEKPLPKRQTEYLSAPAVDPGVHWLKDPYLQNYTLRDFPRLDRFLELHHTARPAVCLERAQLLTDFFRREGFETKKDGTPWVPEERQGLAFRELMEKKKPLIRKGDLLAGTTTAKEIGVPLYPDGAGVMLWGELLTVHERMLNPYEPLSENEIRALNEDIFPFWAHRNFREYVRDTYHEPLGQQLDERCAATFMWKTVALSHTVLDYPKLLRLGLRGIIAEIETELSAGCSEEKRRTLQAMIHCCEGVIAYARHLAETTEREAASEDDPARKRELEVIARAVSHSPEFPARSLEEAVQAIWIHWVGVHNENTNAGFSLGRMDQWLQPYFEADMGSLTTEAERGCYLRHVLELIGCFYLRCQDHLPMIPDIGNYLFGGSSSDQAITLGGITPEGKDAVNDMTYIFLKVTEMLNMRDPNVNARYHKDVNSDAYLKRLCEVNIHTTATPSIHSDTAVMAALEDHGYDPADVRNWAATGCVEPTLSGKHMGHTNCMMFNLVSPLEMAMNNGYHLLMRWQLGPRTGDAEDLKTFEDFLQAFYTQLDHQADLACEFNYQLGEAHAVLRPTPFMSTLIDGCIAGGVDASKGGARYNSSGVACIGLADVVDSLLAVRSLVYERRLVSLEELFDAVRHDFQGREKLRQIILHEAPRFGSDNEEAAALANRVAAHIHECFQNHTNYRGGVYTTGFWSMSNHVAFGSLSGALPSGRHAYMPFTPGLTPEADASQSLLDNLKDVAKLDPHSLDNNIAFNVKVTPSPRDSHETAVDHLAAYVKAYAQLGGMQMQFNVVSSAVMKAALADPESYRDLMVRISGYNAYFTELNRDLQLELIRRADYQI